MRDNIQIGKNLRKFRKSIGLNQGDFANKIKMGQSQLSAFEKGNRNLSHSAISSISENYPSLNIDWLVWNRGVMLFNNHEVELTNNIILLDVQAAAGYAQNFNDLSYITQLPAFNFPHPSFQHGDFRGFQVAGDSMEPTLWNRDYVLASRLYDPNAIKEGYIHVLVTNEGVVVKRVLNRLSQRGKVVIKSDNFSYSTSEVDGSDILEVWIVKAKLSFNLRDINHDLQKDINNLYVELTQLKTDVKQGLLKTSH